MMNVMLGMVIGAASTLAVQWMLRNPEAVAAWRQRLLDTLRRKK